MLDQRNLGILVNELQVLVDAYGDVQWCLPPAYRAAFVDNDGLINN